MIGTILTGSFSFSAFAEGVAAAITVYGLCKGTDRPADSRRNSDRHGSRQAGRKNTGGRK